MADAAECRRQAAECMPTASDSRIKKHRDRAERLRGKAAQLKDGDAKRQLIKIAEQYARCGVNDHIPCRYLDLLAAADRLWE
jgi:hypothetical protein